MACIDITILKQLKWLFNNNEVLLIRALLVIFKWGENGFSNKRNIFVKKKKNYRLSNLTFKYRDYG